MQEKYIGDSGDFGKYLLFKIHSKLMSMWTGYSNLTVRLTSNDGGENEVGIHAHGCDAGRRSCRP